MLVDGLSIEAIPASGGTEVNSSAPISGLVILRACPSISSLMPLTGVPLLSIPAALACKSEAEVKDGSTDTECASMDAPLCHADKLE